MTDDAKPRPGRAQVFHDDDGRILSLAVIDLGPAAPMASVRSSLQCRSTVVDLDLAVAGLDLGEIARAYRVDVRGGKAKLVPEGDRARPPKSGATRRKG